MIFYALEYELMFLQLYLHFSSYVTSFKVNLHIKLWMRLIKDENSNRKLDRKEFLKMCWTKEVVIQSLSRNISAPVLFRNEEVFKYEWYIDIFI